MFVEEARSPADPLLPNGAMPGTGAVVRESLLPSDDEVAAAKAFGDRWPTVQKFAREESVAVVRAEVVNVRVEGAYLDLRVTEPVPELGLQAGDVVAAYESSDALTRKHGLASQRDTVRVGDRRFVLLVKAWWRWHALQYGDV